MRAEDDQFGKWMVRTAAILIALAFAAGIFFHEHDKPRIIGELDAGDASDISKVTLDFERGWKKDAMRADLKSWKFGELARLIYNYPLLKVQSIEAIDSEDAVVRLGIGNKKQSEYVLEKEGDSWDITSRAGK